MSETMRNLFPYLLLSLVPGVIACLVTLIRDADEKTKRRVSNAPVLGIVGLIGSLICGFISLGCCIEGADDGFKILFAASALLMQILILWYVNCRIEYDDDGFVHKDLFGVRRHYGYADVTGIKVNDHESFVCLGRRRVMVDEIAVDGGKFLLFVEKRYRATHRGEEIPVRTPKLDLYNGHIVNGHGLVVASIIMYVFCFGFLAFVLLLNQYPDEKIETREVSFVSCREPKSRIGDWRLTDDQGCLYKVVYQKGVTDTDAFRAFAAQPSECTITGRMFNSKNKDESPYMHVLTISRDGQDVISQAQADRYVRRDKLGDVVMALVFLGLWSLYFIPGIFIGRDPNRHPKLAKLLFEERNIIWDL